jgi:nucleotide-binding universal stress UspA family protein
MPTSCSGAALNGAPCAVAVAARGYAEHPVPFAKIGVGYDASPESEAALATAREIAGTAHATLHALDVVSIPAYIYNGFTPVAGLAVGEMLEDATKQMSAIEGVDGRAVEGLPQEELGLFSAGMDLLVVGSRGYGPLRRLILGSTSAALQRHARCSLLVLPRAAIRAAQAEHAAA